MSLYTMGWTLTATVGLALRKRSAARSSCSQPTPANFIKTRVTLAFGGFGTAAVGSAAALAAAVVVVAAVVPPRFVTAMVVAEDAVPVAAVPVAAVPVVAAVDGALPP